MKGYLVYLRPPHSEELSFIRRLWSDPETMEPVGGPIELCDADAPDWFARMVDPGSTKDCYCLIFDKDDTPVGEISFHEWNPQDRTAKLNLKVQAFHRRRGYAKDALRAFLGYFFDRLGGESITDDIALPNAAGRHLLASVGFQEDTDVSHVHRMRMTREVFAALYD